MKRATTAQLPPQFVPLIPVLSAATGISEPETRELLETIYRTGFADGMVSSLDEALKQASEALGLPMLTTTERGEA